MNRAGDPEADIAHI